MYTTVQSHSHQIVHLLILALLFTGAPLSAATSVAITCFGDSHTAKAIWTNQLQERLEREDLLVGPIHVRAFGGWTVINHLDRATIDSAWIAPPASSNNVALVLIGTNGYYPDELEEFIDLLETAGFFPLILTTPPRRGPDTSSGAGGPGSNQAYNEIIRARYPLLSIGTILNRSHIDVVPQLLDPSIPTSFGEWLNPIYNDDNVHLTADGYETLGNEVALSLLRSLRGNSDLRLVRNNGLIIETGLTAQLFDSDLRAGTLNWTDADITFTLTVAPGGLLRKSGVPLSTGGAFTQSDLNLGLITYTAGPSPVNDAAQIDIESPSGSLTGISIPFTVIPPPPSPDPEVAASQSARPEFWSWRCGNGSNLSVLLLLIGITFHRGQPSNRVTS